MCRPREKLALYSFLLRSSSLPPSAAKNPTSIPRLYGSASRKSGASGVPVHWTLATAPMNPAEALLPEHSNVAVTVLRRRDLRSARENFVGFLTRPPNSSCHVAGSILGSL